MVRGSLGPNVAVRAAPTRERLLRAAIRLFQTRGYHATGVTEILAAAEAPKGSLYHHYPEGKEQIAEAAIRSISSDIERLIATRRAAGASAAEIIRSLARGMADWLRRTGWREGGLLATMAHEVAPHSPRLHAALQRAYSGWRAALAEAIESEGVDARESRHLASLAIAVLAGGLVLSRIEQRASALTEAAERVAAMVRDSGVRPGSR